MKNFYKILEVDKDASVDVIEKAYKVLAKKYHPDLQETEEQKKKAEEKIKEINEAYEILKDEEKRKKYNVEYEREYVKASTTNNVQNNAYNTYTHQTTHSQTYQGTENANRTANYNNANIRTGVNNSVVNNQNKQSKQYGPKRYKRVTTVPLKDIDPKRYKQKEKLRRRMQDEYLRQYGEYLSRNGYRVKYRADWRKLPILLLVIVITIVVGVVLWYIPVTRNYLISIYENNWGIKKIFDVFFNLLK